MKKNLIEIITMLGAILVTVGFSSCSREETPIVPELKVVSSAEVSFEVGDDAQTKALYDAGVLYWQEGDQLVLYSNNNINGTLSCTSVDGSGKATFSGTITNFTPEAINVYFFCNKPVDSDKPAFDFSLQNGNAASVSQYSFLKSVGVEFVEAGEHQYKAADKLQFQALTSILNISVDNADGPVPVGTKAHSVMIDGLKNQMTVNLETGDVSSNFVKSPDLGISDQQEDYTMTKIYPRYKSNLSTNYLVALIPQNATAVTMVINYNDGSYNGLKTYWENISWDIAEGSSYTTDWSRQGGLSIVGVSQKTGYAGVAIDTGENADGTSHKGGYDGVAVDGINGDKGLGNKVGYDGTEVI